MSLVSRIKSWIDEENLTDEDLNAEFDNVLDNLTSEFVDGWSTNVSQMQEQTTPGGLGTESLALSVSDELERLRYVINRLMGTTYWYEAPEITLNQIDTLLDEVITLPPNRIVSGKIRGSGSNQPLFLQATGNAASLTLRATDTDFVYQIANTEYTLTADVAITGLQLAPASQNTCTVDDAQWTDQPSSKLAGETLIGGEYTAITVNAMGTNISNLTGKYAAFKLGTEYFIAFVESSTRLSKAFRGFFFGSNNSPIPRETIADNDVITLMKLTWIFIKTNGAIDIAYNNPVTSAVEPTSPASGDYWYDLVDDEWKKYTGTVWASASALLVGVSVQDGTNCVATRSFDFYTAHSQLMSLQIEEDAATSIRTKQFGARVVVDGNLLDYKNSLIYWDITTDRDSGVGATEVIYYLYLKDDGSPVLSDIAPFDRSFDLLGLYHPFNPWRFVGSAAADGGGSFLGDGFIYSSGQIINQNIGDREIDTRNINPEAITSEKLRSSNFVKSNSSGIDPISSNTFGNVVNQIVNIESVGRPIMVGIMPDESTNAALFGGSSSSPLIVEFRRNGTTFATAQVAETAAQSFSPIITVDTGAIAGNNVTYTLVAKTSGAPTNNAFIQYIKIFATEIL